MAVAAAAISEFALTAHLLLEPGGVPFEGLFARLGASGPASSGPLSYHRFSCPLNGDGCGDSRYIATRGASPTPRNLNSMVAWGTKTRLRDGSMTITWKECIDSDDDLASLLSPSDTCKRVPHSELVGYVVDYMKGHLTSAHPISNLSDDFKNARREEKVKLEDQEKETREVRARLIGASTMHILRASFGESLSAVRHHPRALVPVDLTCSELGGPVVEDGAEEVAARLALGSYDGMRKQLDARDALFEAGGSLFRLLESCRPSCTEGLSLIHKVVGDTGPASRHLAFRGGLSRVDAATIETGYAWVEAVSTRRRNAFMRYGRGTDLRIHDVLLACLADKEVIAEHGLLPAVEAECVANCELLGLGLYACRQCLLFLHPSKI